MPNTARRCSSRSEALTAERGRGFGVENLRLFRKVYLTYHDRAAITLTPSRRSPAEIPQTPSGISSPRPMAPAAISQTPSAISDRPPFTLSWSHYVFLIGLKDPDERAFYEVESHNNGFLCKQNHEALVEVTLSEEACVHAREYKLVLPSKADLRRKLLEWTGEDVP